MNLYKQNKGYNYELFILNKLKLQYDEVFFYKFTPERILQHTKLFNNYDIYTKYKNCDIGADLVAVKDGEVYFIQCKNHNDTLCINNLQGFYFLLYEFNLNGIVIYSNEISSRIKDLSNKVQYLHIPYNNQIIDVNYNFLNNINIKPRDYQLEAYDILKDENRSILALPSGMGLQLVTLNFIFLYIRYYSLYFLNPFIFATNIFIICNTSITNSVSGSLLLFLFNTITLPLERSFIKSSINSKPKRANRSL